MPLLPAPDTDWPELDRLLDEALDLPAERRAAWLDTLPPATARHAPALRRLLDAHDRAAVSDWMSAPPRLETVAGDPGAPSPGDAVGPYRLIEELGRGGMATVWLAERSDGQLNRRIALKLPHRSWAPGLAERMVRERDILATLEHPRIARLYDAGIDGSGRPYLALEAVSGLPIDRHCQQRALDVRARLRLVLQVAEAVSYAHGRLVIHRDLKPSNLIVSDDGQVHLLDFGIARLLDGDGIDSAPGDLTRAAGQALTPDYASPEQVAGLPLSTASDQYSLAVVAYELLCGRRPPAPRRTDGDVAPVDLVPASRCTADPAVRRLLRGDLDAILAQALRGDPRRRYPSVDAFAEDIGRWLRGEPVRARPDTWAYRARRFLGRHRWPVAAASVAAVALAATAAVAVWQAQRAVQERERAQDVRDFIASLFQNADPNHGGQAGITARDLLQRAEARIDAELAGRPDTAAELLLVVGESLFRLDDVAGATRVIDRAAALTAPRPPTDLLRLRADRLRAELMVEGGQIAPARDLIEQVLQRTNPRDREQALLRVGALQVRAMTAYNLDDAEGTMRHAQAAATLSESMLGEAHVDTLASWMLVAYYARLVDQDDQALAAARRAVELADRHFARVPNLQASLARAVLARTQAESGQLDVGIAGLRAVRQQVARDFGPRSSTAQWLAVELADLLDRRGDLHAAVVLLRETVGADTDLPPRVQAERVHNLGYQLLSVRSPEAAGVLRDAVARWQQEVGPTHAHTLTARTYLALALAGTGDRAGALQAWPEVAEPGDWEHRQAAELWRRLGDPGRQWAHAQTLATAAADAKATPLSRARNARALALALVARGEPAKALPWAEQALRDYAAAQPKVTPDQADVFVARAAAQQALGQATSARASLRDAAAFWDDFDATNADARAVRKRLRQAGGPPVH